jgi:hypothetical protein
MPPTLKSSIDAINAMAQDARGAAVALSKHHRHFDGDAAAQATIKRIESIMVDFANSIANVSANMTPDIAAALDQPR